MPGVCYLCFIHFVYWMLAQSKHRAKLRNISSPESHVSILSSFCLSINTYVSPLPSSSSSLLPCSSIYLCGGSTTILNSLLYLKSRLVYWFVPSRQVFMLKWFCWCWSYDLKVFLFLFFSHLSNPNLNNYRPN